MTYSPNIPLPGDYISDSQQDIKNNFAVEDAVMTINHYQFSINDGKQGKHRWCELVNQSSYPLTQAAGEGSIFTKNISPTPLVNNDSQIFYTPDATGREYQLTTFIESQFATFATNTQYQLGPPDLNGGWSFLPGGLLLQYGKINSVISVGPTASVITFPIPFKTGTKPFSITLGLTATYTGLPFPNVLIQENGITHEVFTVSSSTLTNGPKVYWMAIGIVA